MIMKHFLCICHCFCKPKSYWRFSNKILKNKDSEQWAFNSPKNLSPVKITCYRVLGMFQNTMCWGRGTPNKYMMDGVYSLYWTKEKNINKTSDVVSGLWGREKKVCCDLPPPHLHLILKNQIIWQLMISSFFHSPQMLYYIPITMLI